MTASIKALTISQPYASLIAAGVKWVENRTWATAYRGPLAIHAGKRSAYLPAAELKRYPRGVILATCRLTACCRLADIDDDALSGSGRTAAEVRAHVHAAGPVCWILGDVRLVSPQPATGALTLWDYDGPPLLSLPRHADPLAHLGPFGTWR